MFRLLLHWASERFTPAEMLYVGRSPSLITDIQDDSTKLLRRKKKIIVQKSAGNLIHLEAVSGSLA